jgi:23S rRNA (uridine2479-2'-O)-methyltransferase
MQITVRNARYQQWQALLSNRSKRSKAGEFLVHGVRPITLAAEYAWPIHAVLHNRERSLSQWARDFIDSHPDAEHYAVAGDLIGDLGEKSEQPELIAVVGMPDDDLAPISPDGLGVLFDRPSSPGNIGTIVRSADAFGASYLIVTGHAADPYDPKSVRASAGSLFAVPVVRVPAPQPVLDWLAGHATQLVATDEHGSVELDEADLTGPTLLLIGNETAGLAAAWREAATVTVRIPMTGAASSLNAASAASVALYEAARQRRR